MPEGSNQFMVDWKNFGRQIQQFLLHSGYILGTVLKWELHTYDIA